MKTNKLFFKISSLLLAGVMLFASCRSTTLIETIPSGAKLYINGEYAGVTPYSYSDTKIVGSTNHVRLEKEGYETTNANFSRDEEADIGAIVGGVFLLFPFLWTMKYKPVHTYEMIPLGSPTVSNDESQRAIQNDLLENSDEHEYVSGVLKD